MANCPTGELPSGELPGDELTGGELPSGKLPGGELPSGKLPGDELPSGVSSCTRGKRSQYGQQSGHGPFPLQFTV